MGIQNMVINMLLISTKIVLFELYKTNIIIVTYEKQTFLCRNNIAINFRMWGQKEMHSLQQKKVR